MSDEKKTAEEVQKTIEALLANVVGTKERLDNYEVEQNLRIARERHALEVQVESELRRRAEDKHRLESNLLNMEHNRASIAYINQNMALREREIRTAEQQANALERIAAMLEARGPFR